MSVFEVTDVINVTKWQMPGILSIIKQVRGVCTTNRDRFCRSYTLRVMHVGSTLDQAIGWDISGYRLTLRLPTVESIFESLDLLDRVAAGGIATLPTSLSSALRADLVLRTLKDSDIDGIRKSMRKLGSQDIPVIQGDLSPESTKRLRLEEAKLNLKDATTALRQAESSWDHDYSSLENDIKVAERDIKKLDAVVAVERPKLKKKLECAKRRVARLGG